MKKLILSVFILSGAFNLNAQCDSTLPISENFSDATAVNYCWDYIDADGDGYNWHIVNLSGNPGLVSESYTGASGYLTPDNWVITNAIDLTGYNPSSGIQLSWKVRTPDWSFDQERYTVYVATGNQISNFIASPVSVYENLDNSDAAGINYANRSLDISSLAGNVVYVAFRHWASVFQNQINIDDVAISASGSSGGCTLDSDGDGVCDANDLCPNTPANATVDATGCIINTGCQESTTNFNGNTLNGSNTATLTLPSNSQDVSFTISGIGEKLKGKSSMQYVEIVEVLFDKGVGSGYQIYETYSGATISDASINIQGSVSAVKVILKDELGNTDSNLSINFSAVTYCSSSVACTDSDNDGVCDTDDLCPNTPANAIVDATGCVITGCQESTTNFNGNALSGSNTATMTLPSNSQDVSFTISGIGEKTKGKPDTQYIEKVEVLFDNGSGYLTYGNFSGATVNSVSINIPGIVTSVKVTLSDELGNSSSNLSINFSSVTYCSNSTQSKNSVEPVQNNDQINGTLDTTIKAYPNPASQSLYVKYIDDNAIQTNNDISLYNNKGELVRNLNLNNRNGQTNEIDIKGLPTGLYLLRIVDQNGDLLKVERIIIK